MHVEIDRFHFCSNANFQHSSNTRESYKYDLLSVEYSFILE